MLSETSPLPKRTVRITWIITVLAFLYYVVLITRGTLDLFGQEVLGLVFNNMYTNLLHGNLELDPDVLRYKNVFEAMIKDGKTYMYFGVFPAFLRGLFAPFVDLSVTYISRISVLLGLFLSVYFQVKAMLRLLGALNSDPFINWLYYLLLMSLSDNPFTLGPELGRRIDEKKY